MSTPIDNDAALDDVLLAVVREAGEPIPATKVRSKLPGKRKPAAQEVGRRLDELAAAGQLHRLMPAKAKTPSFWTEPIDALARRLILAALDDGPLTPAQLRPRLKAVAKFAAASRLDQIRKGLVAEGIVFEHPQPKGRGAGRLGLRPADPRDYLDEPLAAFRKALDALAKKLEPAGVDRAGIEAAALERVRSEFAAGEPAPTAAEAAPSPTPTPFPLPVPADPTPPDGSDLGPTILERMVELVPASINGASVSLRDLRRSMEFLTAGPTAFDTAVLRLADEGRVDLHRHDFPAGLSETERIELVADGRGGYYIGISRREG